MSKRFKMYPLSVYKGGVKGEMRIVEDKDAQDKAAEAGFLPIVDLSQPDEDPEPAPVDSFVVPVVLEDEPVKRGPGRPPKARE